MRNEKHELQTSRREMSARVGMLKRHVSLFDDVQTDRLFTKVSEVRNALVCRANSP
jgi:hypothetical protein